MTVVAYHKSYVFEIRANNGKMDYLNNTLDVLDELSWFVFTLGTRYSKSWWRDQKNLYNYCRLFFPDINSKVLQNFISLYKPKGKKTLPKKHPKKAAIYVDQAFYIEHPKTAKIAKLWVKFHRHWFPLFGRLFKKFKLSDVKLIHIYKRKSRIFCQLMLTTLTTLSQGNKVAGLDTNFRNLVVSTRSKSKFFNLKPLAHRKLEYYKNNQQNRSLSNFTKDFLHKITNQVRSFLCNEEVDVLVLEDLTNLRSACSGKNKKGKKCDFIVNSLPFASAREMLTYKCLEEGIRIETINPAYTSKRCSRCGSLNTSRPRQCSFICNDCNFNTHADLNASRNIRSKYVENNISRMGNSVNLAQVDVIA